MTYKWEMLPIILERCPNLKDSILPEPWRVLQSLEYVKIERPFEGVAVKLVSTKNLLSSRSFLPFQDSLPHAKWMFFGPSH
ncbi:unnamed protein product [Thlaspi arvense]|uniref:Uncharacterized protein n=1 Tax=Thlaspi arvense TaxID=13288 RepID=A0AAU9SPD5_THLAR|nr:unnamed protein product [Thlaspi arvense]